MGSQYSAVERAPPSTTTENNTTTTTIAGTKRYSVYGYDLLSLPRLPLAAVVHAGTPNPVAARTQHVDWTYRRRRKFDEDIGDTRPPRNKNSSSSNTALVFLSLLEREAGLLVTFLEFWFVQHRSQRQGGNNNLKEVLLKRLLCAFFASLRLEWDLPASCSIPFWQNCLLRLDSLHSRSENCESSAQLQQQQCPRRGDEIENLMNEENNNDIVDDDNDTTAVKPLMGDEKLYKEEELIVMSQHLPIPESCSRNVKLPELARYGLPPDRLLKSLSKECTDNFRFNSYFFQLVLHDQRDLVDWVLREFRFNKFYRQVFRPLPLQYPTDIYGPADVLLCQLVDHLSLTAELSGEPATPLHLAALLKRTVILNALKREYLVQYGHPLPEDVTDVLRRLEERPLLF